jgi:hypothetical protein
MKLVHALAVGGLVALPALAATPSQAATAFQQWAQGQGVYVTSKDRLSTWQDDLAGMGLAPPPPPPGYAYRYRRPVPPPDWGYDDDGY